MARALDDLAGHLAAADQVDFVGDSRRRERQERHEEQARATHGHPPASNMDPGRSGVNLRTRRAIVDGSRRVESDRKCATPRRGLGRRVGRRSSWPRGWASPARLRDPAGGCSGCRGSSRVSSWPDRRRRLAGDKSGARRRRGAVGLGLLPLVVLACSGLPIPGLAALTGPPLLALALAGFVTVLVSAGAWRPPSMGVLPRDAPRLSRLASYRVAGPGRAPKATSRTT